MSHVSNRSVVIAFVIASLAACGTASDVGKSSAAASTCPWDPGFGTDNCYQGDWWIEFSVTDTTTTSMQIEVQNTARVIQLTNVERLDDGAIKFTGGPDDGPVSQGTMVRITVTSSSNQTASSNWFAYMSGTPVVTCGDAGTTTTDAGTTQDSGTDAATQDSGTDATTQDSGTDATTQDSGTDATTTKDSGSGGGGSDGGCVPSWNPYWQQTQYAGEYWVEYVVQGGGSLPVSVGIELAGTTYPLSYAYGKWTGGPGYIPTGTTVVLHAKDATGATAKSAPFAYLVNQNPSTDPCSTTPSSSQTCLPLTRGMLSLTMDDSYPSQETLAAPVMAKYGMKATIYNITSQLSLNGELPYAQALASQGHEVGSHTVNHYDLTTATVSDIDYELSASQAYLLANVGTPVDSFATPMGSYNSTVLAEIKKYYASHRTVNPGLNYMGSSVYELNSDGAYNTVSPATICAGLQDAAKYHGWRILMFHDFTTASTSNADLLYTIADFESILKCAQSISGLDVVTVHDGANKIRCASP